MSQIKPTPKLYDTSGIAPGGKVEQHWEQSVYKDVFGSRRSGKKFPQGFNYADQNKCLKHFGLKAFEYGNWLNQHDRYQYLVGCTVSLHDMIGICNLSAKQIGLAGKLSIAFGARGNGGALAHFEPMTFAINITRYSESERGNDLKFLHSGGVGSLGHEWAHGLDFYLGRYVDKSTDLNFLSHVISGRMIRKGELFELKEYPKSELTSAFFDLMLKIIYEPIKGRKGVYRYNKWYKGLYDRVMDEGNGLGRYWILKHELFARAFEVYLFYKGISKKIVNPFLRKTKYISAVYSDKAHFKTWEKQMDKIMVLAKKHVPNK